MEGAKKDVFFSSIGIILSALGNASAGKTQLPLARLL